MRFRHAIMITAAVFCLQLSPAAGDDAATIDEIRSAVFELDRAFTDHDTATIERMVTPDHVAVAARFNGEIALAEQTATVDAMQRTVSDYSPVDVRLLGDDAAFVTFEKSYTGTFAGKALIPRVFVSEVWLRQEGTWRQWFYQETPVAGR